MTQTQNRTFTTGAEVTHRTEEDLVHGEIIESNPWYDTLKLRGVAANAQVLVSWETSADSGAPVPLWSRKTDLDFV